MFSLRFFHMVNRNIVIILLTYITIIFENHILGKNSQWQQVDLSLGLNSYRTISSP